MPLTASDRLFFRDGEVAIFDGNDDTRRTNAVLVALEIVVKGKGRVSKRLVPDGRQGQSLPGCLGTTPKRHIMTVIRDTMTR